MPDTWHICASSLQKVRATLSCTLREKFMHAQRLTVIPLIIFCIIQVLGNKHTSIKSHHMKLHVKQEKHTHYNFIKIYKILKLFDVTEMIVVISICSTLFIIFHWPTWGKQFFSLPLSWYLSCKQNQFKWIIMRKKVYCILGI